MKKLIIMSFIATILLLGCGPKSVHDIRFIVLTDQVNAKFAEDLRFTFFTYRDPNGYVLTQFLPDSVRKVTFAIYHPYMEKADDPLLINFNAADDKPRR